MISRLTALNFDVSNNIWTQCYTSIGAACVKFPPQSDIGIKEKYFAESMDLARAQSFLIMDRKVYNSLSYEERLQKFHILYDTPAELALLKGFQSSGSHVERVKVPFKTWFLKRKSGEIVVNPLRKYKFNITEVPSLEPVDPGLERNSPRYGMNIKALAPIVGPGECMPHLTSQLLGESTTSISNNAFNVDCSGKDSPVTNVTGALYFSSDDALGRFGHLLMNEIDEANQVQDVLVTATRSAANSGTYDLLTELAELPETVKFLYGVLKEIVTLFRNTRKEALRLGRLAAKNDSLALADSASAIANLWLAYRYAVKPLCYSANDLLELLSIQSSNYLSFRDGLPTKVTVNPFGTATEISGIDRCFIKRRFGTEGTGKLDHLKLDVLATAWELVPLSFVVDWAFNVGDFLSAFSIPGAVQQEAVTYSSKNAGLVTFTTPVGSTVVVQFEQYRVTPIDPNDHIGLNLDVFMNLNRTLDALALSWSMFSGKVRRR